MKQFDFVHIGFQKTATTWLQTNHFFHPKIQILNIDQHATFLNEFVYRSDFLFEPNSFRNKFQQILQNRPADTCYGLSWERLSGDMLSGLDAKPLAERMYAVLGQTRIVIVIRNQLSMLASCYNQYVQMGGACDFKTFVNDRDIAGSRLLERLCYHGLICFYQNLFGHENVHVAFYENIQRAPKKFLHRLWTFLGMPICNVNISNDHVNRSTSPHMLFLKRQLNHLFSLPYNKTSNPALPYELHQYVRYHLFNDEAITTRFNEILATTHPQKKLLACLSETKRTQLSTYFHESNQKLVTLLSMDFKDLGYL